MWPWKRKKLKLVKAWFTYDDPNGRSHAFGVVTTFPAKWSDEKIERRLLEACDGELRQKSCPYLHREDFPNQVLVDWEKS